VTTTEGKKKKKKFEQVGAFPSFLHYYWGEKKKKKPARWREGGITRHVTQLEEGASPFHSETKCHFWGFRSESKKGPPFSRQSKSIAKKKKGQTPSCSENQGCQA